MKPGPEKKQEDKGLLYNISQFSNRCKLEEYQGLPVIVLYSFFHMHLLVVTTEVKTVNQMSLYSDPAAYLLLLYYVEEL